MKRALLFLLFFILAKTTLAAVLVDTSAVRVAVCVPALKLQKLYMGSYFGKFQTVVDSMVLSDSSWYHKKEILAIGSLFLYTIFSQ